MSVLTPQIISQVALLARLRLTAEDAVRLTGQLEQILAYVQRLNTVPTDGVEPTSHVLPLRNVIRQDVPQPCLGAEVVVALAPASHAVFVKVPKVIEG